MRSITLYAVIRKMVTELNPLSMQLYNGQIDPEEAEQIFRDRLKEAQSALAENHDN